MISKETRRHSCGALDEPKRIMMRHALEFCNYTGWKGGGLLLARDSWDRARDAEERQQCDDADHEDGNHLFFFSDTSNMHELDQSAGPCILFTGKDPSPVLPRRGSKT